MLVYSWSPILSQISLKNSLGKGFFFQIFPKIEMTPNENHYILLEYGCI